MIKKKIIIIVVSILLFAVITGCAIYFLVSFFCKTSEKYDEANLFKNGYVAVKKDGNWGIIDKKGKAVIPFEYEDAKVCESGNLFLVKEDGKYGFVNKNGIFEISNVYDDADIFSENGLAPVEKNDKWGYINNKGEYVIKPQYELAFEFQGKTAVVSIDGKNYLIDENGDKYFKKGYFNISNYSDSDEYFEVTEEKGDTFKDGIVDINGNEIIVPQFDSVRLNDNETVIAEKNKKNGVLDFNGKYILEPIFDDIYYSPKQKVYTAKKGKATEIFDENGDKIVDKDFERELTFGENGLVPINKNKKWGYIDVKGEYVIEPQFEDAKKFGAFDMAPIKKEGKWGYIDDNGKIVIEPVFDDAEPFGQNGVAYVKSDHASDWGCIDKDGAGIISCLYHKFMDYDDVVVLGSDNKKIFLFNAKGEKLNDEGFDAIGNFDEHYCKQEGCYNLTTLRDYCYDHRELDDEFYGIYDDLD